MVERLLFTSNAYPSKPKTDGVGLAKYYEKKKNADYIVFEFTGLRFNEETDCLNLVKLVFSKKD